MQLLANNAIIIFLTYRRDGRFVQ